MASKLDAKHEKIIKALQRLPDNKRCFDCETLGPQYVVFPFNVFVCMDCSGIHREYGHRCKGVSLASFKPAEVSDLEKGGNAVAQRTWLAKWSPNELPRPTDRNTQKVRNWIEVVFQRKQYYEQSKPFREEDIPIHDIKDILGNNAVKIQSYPSLDKLKTAATVPASAATPGALISLSSPTKHTQLEATASLPATTTSSAAWSAFDTPSAAAAPDDQWASFGQGQHAASQQQQGWSTFPADASPASKSASSPAPASQPPPGQLQDWIAFSGSAKAAVPATETSAPVVPEKPAMRELPPDLFSEPVRVSPPRPYGMHPATGYGGGIGSGYYPGMAGAAGPPPGYPVPRPPLAQQYPGPTQQYGAQPPLYAGQHNGLGGAGLSSATSSRGPASVAGSLSASNSEDIEGPDVFSDIVVPGLKGLSVSSTPGQLSPQSSLPQQHSFYSQPVTQLAAPAGYAHPYGASGGGYASQPVQGYNLIQGYKPYSSTQDHKPQPAYGFPGNDTQLFAQPARQEAAAPQNGLPKSGNPFA